MKRRLVPIAVAILGLALFWWTRSGPDDTNPLAEMNADVRECTANLLAIYDGLRAYNERFGHPPEESGVAFFAALVNSGVWDDATASIDRLTCPGTNAQAVPPGTRFADLDSLTTASSAYAGRNSSDHPLEHFPSGGPDVQALVACDNATGSNHDGVTNVLYSDRTVKTFEIELLHERGIVPAETPVLRIGPDSPLEDVRTLVGD